MFKKKEIEIIKTVILKEAGAKFEYVRTTREIPVCVVSAISFIHNNLFNPFANLNELKIINPSTKSRNFSSLFKYYIGKTPKKYWLCSKIEAAAGYGPITP